MSDMKAGNAHPLGHVLAIVPLHEFGLVGGVNVGPNSQKSLRFGRAHGLILYAQPLDGEDGRDHTVVTLPQTLTAASLS